MSNAQKGTETKGLAIFAGGMYMWLSEETDRVEAIRDFEENVGINSDDLSMEDLADEHEFYEIPAHQWDEWANADGMDHPSTDEIQFKLDRYANPEGREVYSVIGGHVGSPRGFIQGAQHLENKDEAYRIKSQGRGPRYVKREWVTA